MKTLLAALVLMFALPCELGCATAPDPAPDFPTVDEAADCAVESAKDQFYDLLPRVNTVLAQGGSWGSVIDQLLQMAAGFTINGIECLIAKIGSDAGEAVAMDADNVVAASKAKRASVLLEVFERARQSDEDVGAFLRNRGASVAAEVADTPPAGGAGTGG